MKLEMDTRRGVQVSGEIEGVKDNGTRRRREGNRYTS
jgi:hypothetical protein